MLKNIVKIILIILTIAVAPLSLANTIHQPVVSGTSMEHHAKVMILAKGQYINDSRNYKPGVECCIC